MPVNSAQQSPPEPDSNNARSLAVTLIDEDIFGAIRSFPAGSAGGLDGLRPQHLKDMTNSFTGMDGVQLIASLADFANMCLAGRVPLTVRASFLRRLAVRTVQEGRRC